MKGNNLEMNKNPRSNIHCSYGGLLMTMQFTLNSPLYLVVSKYKHFYIWDNSISRKQNQTSSKQVDQLQLLLSALLHEHTNLHSFPFITIKCTGKYNTKPEIKS